MLLYFPSNITLARFLLEWWVPKKKSRCRNGRKGESGAKKDFRRNPDLELSWTKNIRIRERWKIITRTSWRKGKTSYFFFFFFLNRNTRNIKVSIESFVKTKSYKKVLSFLCLVLYKLISNTWHEYKWTWEIVLLHIGICNWKIWKYKLLHSTLVGYNIYIVLFHLIQYYFQIE